MKSKLLAIVFMLYPLASDAAEIASVNFEAIKGGLREYYFGKPENSEIKEKFASAVRDEKAFQEEVQKSLWMGISLSILDLRCRKAVCLSAINWRRR